MGRKSLCGFVGTSFGTKYWLTLDNCGIICISISYSVLIFSFFEVYNLFISDDLVAALIFGLLYAPSTVLALTSLFMAWSTDPGAVPMGAKPIFVEQDEEAMRLKDKSKKQKPKRGIRRCRKCSDNYKPPRAHHDSHTGRCVVKMDHFCPWICNAVGALNHKFFFLFVLYTFTACVSCLILIFVRLIRCGNPPSNDVDKINTRNFFVRYVSFFITKSPNFESDSCNNIFSSAVLFLSIVAILFMMFTLCMLFDQVEAIKSNISKIARMKMKRENGDLNSNPELARVSSEFNEIFGGNSPSFSWHWLLPLSVKFPPGMYDQVMGYKWDSTFLNEPYRPPSSKVCIPVPNNIESTSSTEEEVCASLLEKPESVSNPLGKGTVDDSPLLQPDSGMKRRNTSKEEEQVSLLNGESS